MKTRYNNVHRWGTCGHWENKKYSSIFPLIYIWMPEVLSFMICMYSHTSPTLRRTWRYQRVEERSSSCYYICVSWMKTGEYIFRRNTKTNVISNLACSYSSDPHINLHKWLYPADNCNPADNRIRSGYESCLEFALLGNMFENNTILICVSKMQLWHEQYACLSVIYL